LSSTRRLRWIDRALALGVALLIFQVYFVTIYPGLFGMGDAAKFSFVGKVLGTPHAPGYPMYVWVSHLFSYVPWGTLAFRMNVLSALLGALAVFFLYFAARAMGTRPAVAASAALACGLGRAFWAKSQYAKGYTLTAALVCAGLVLLLRWSQTGRRSLFYWAIAVFTFSIGNHLIIVSILPALVLHALMTNARLALAPRTILLTVGLLAVGFSQYSLILIRTWQQAPYLEARATTFTELVEVVTARRYANEIGAFAAADVVRTRVPVVAGLVARELTWPGLALVLVGAVVLLRRRARDAVLCVGGAVGVMALTVNMSSNEDEGFMLSAFLLLWLLAAFGLEAIWSWRGRLGAIAALIVSIGLPASQVAGNYVANDHHRRTFETRYFNALFERLPDKSAIVMDKYPTNMMLNYKLFGEGAAAGRDIVMVPSVPEQVVAIQKRGYKVFLFDQARVELAQFDYRVEPVQLSAEPFPEYLPQVREGFTVVVAATPVAAAGLMSHPQGWAHIGVSPDRVFRKVGTPYGVIGVAGARGTALEAPEGNEVNVSLASGAAVGTTNALAPAEIRVQADSQSAAIWIGGKEQGRTSDGAVVAVVSPSGSVLETFVLRPADEFRVPFDMRLFPFFELTSAGTCLNLGNQGWRDISTLPVDGRVTLRIDNYRAFESRATFYVVGDRPAAPTLFDARGTGELKVSAQSFRTGDAAERRAMARVMADDNQVLPLDAPAGSVVSRVEVAVNDNGDYKAALLDLGLHPMRTLVRVTVDLNNPRRATVCGAAPGISR